MGGEQLRGPQPAALAEVRPRLVDQPLLDADLEPALDE